VSWFRIRTEEVSPLDKKVGPKVQVVLDFPGLTDDIRMTPAGADELGHWLQDCAKACIKGEEVTP
jgi:hypothetical protein